MKAEEQIKAYINSQPEPKQKDMETLHRLILKILPKGKLAIRYGIKQTN